MSVLKSEPDWNALPATVPDHIRTLLKRCLVKDHRQRVSDSSIALYVMGEDAPGAARVARITDARVARKRLLTAAGIGLLAPESRLAATAVPPPASVNGQR